MAGLDEYSPLQTSTPYNPADFGLIAPRKAAVAPSSVGIPSGQVAGEIEPPPEVIAAAASGKPFTATMQPGETTATVVPGDPSKQSKTPPAAPKLPPLKWDQVANSESFKARSFDEQDRIRQQYFVDYIAPKVPTDQLEAVKASYDSDTKLSMAGKAWEVAKGMASAAGERIAESTKDSPFSKPASPLQNSVMAAYSRLTPEKRNEIAAQIDPGTAAPAKRAFLDLHNESLNPLLAQEALKQFPAGPSRPGPTIQHGLEQVATPDAIADAKGRAAQVDATPERIAGVGEKTSRRIIDTLLIDVPKGVVGLGESTVGIASMTDWTRLVDPDKTGLVVRGMKAIGYDADQTKKILEQSYSDQRKLSEKEYSDAKGVIDTVDALVSNPGMVVGKIAESFPMLLGTMGAAGKAFQAAKAAGMTNAAALAQASTVASAAEGALASGSIAEHIRNENPGEVAKMYYALPAGVATALISKVVGKLPGGSLETMFLAKGPGIAGNALVRGGKGVITEGGLEEMPQSGIEQAATNLGTNKPVGEGMGKAMATGGVIGGAQGGGMALFNRGQSGSEDTGTDKAKADALAKADFNFGQTDANKKNSSTGAPSSDNLPGEPQPAESLQSANKTPNAEKTPEKSTSLQYANSKQQVETQISSASAAFQAKTPETPRQSTDSTEPIDASAVLETIQGDKIDKEWTAFSAESGTLNIPRADMPQVASAHRGALVNFLKGKGVASEQEESVDPTTLKPTQSEYSPAKVEKAMKNEGPDRSILVSSDGYIVDGHHQWMSKLSSDAPINIIRLDSPIKDLLKTVAEFPSSFTAEGAERRADGAQRKKVADMTPDERAKALLTSSVVNLPNLRAFDEQEAEGPANVTGYADGDNFKVVNTILGHDEADKVLRGMADIFNAAATRTNAKAYHRSGDEFLFRFDSPGQAEAFNKAAYDIAKNFTLIVKDLEGNTYEFKNPGFSLGTGTNAKSAEAQADIAKQARLDSGERAGPGQPPIGLSKIASKGKQDSGNEKAGRDDGGVDGTGAESGGNGKALPAGNADVSGRGADANADDKGGVGDSEATLSDQPNNPDATTTVTQSPAQSGEIVLGTYGVMPSAKNKSLSLKKDGDTFILQQDGKDALDFDSGDPITYKSIDEAVADVKAELKREQRRFLSNKQGVYLAPEFKAKNTAPDVKKTSDPVPKQSTKVNETPEQQAPAQSGVSVSGRPKTLTFDGAKANGLSETSAKIEASKRNKSRPDYEWQIESYRQNSEVYPHHPETKWRVAGTLKDAPSAQPDTAPSPDAASKPKGPTAAEIQAIKDKGKATTPPKGKKTPYASLSPAETEEISQLAPEIGWSEYGGRLLRNNEGDAAARTVWFAHSPLWPRRPEPIGIPIARMAIKHLIAGQPMSAIQKRFIDYAREYLRRDNAERASQERDIDKENAAAAINEVPEAENLDADTLQVVVEDAKQLADDVDYFAKEGNSTEAQFMRALGFTEDEINEARNETKDQSGPGQVATGQADGSSARDAQAGRSDGEEGKAEVATSPAVPPASALELKNQTPAELSQAQTKAAEKERQKADDKRVADNAVGAFALDGGPSGKVAPANNANNQGDLLSQAKIEDLGEKIGGARKDRWKDRGMNVSDLDAMSESEGAELATKANVWKPDYEAMVTAGADPKATALTKLVYDKLAAQPKDNTPEGRRRYVTMMQHVRDVYGAVKTEEDAKNAAHKLREAVVPNGTAGEERKAAREVLFSVYKGRSDPFVIFYEERRKAEKMVADGFPAKGEPWKRRFVIRADGGPGLTSRGVELLVSTAQELGTPITPEQTRAGVYRVTPKIGKVVAILPTMADAETAAKNIYEKLGKGEAAIEPSRPNLDELKREGLPQRLDRPVTPEDFLKTFGFRGVEFGNWSAQDERQRILAMAYDGLQDLAEMLNVPPKAMSLNGSMGMAFGARGGGKHLAHYEPGKLVINMTKLRGGGSLAHEWAHALDHYFGELDKKDAYQGKARGASGWYNERNYDKPVGLENLRPELATAFNDVMSAMFKSQQTKAEMVREEELKLERVQGFAAIEKDASLKAMYERRAKALEQNLNELRAEPDDKLFAAGRSLYAKDAQKLSGKSTEGYWLRPTEMFARAFESYAFDKLVAMGAKSDYLVHGVESDRFATGYKGNPYPVGAERTNINTAFDKLFKEIKTEETDKGIALFSKKTEIDGGKPFVQNAKHEYLPDTNGDAERLRREAGRTLGVELPAGSIRLARLPDYAALQKIASAFGKRVVGFESTSPLLNVNGSTFAGGDVIYISVNATRPALAVLGHELGHQFKKESPTEYVKLVDFMREQLDQAKYATKFAGMRKADGELVYKGYNEAAIQEEFVGEVFSDGFMDPGFWYSLANHNQSLFDKVVASLQKLWAKVKDALKPYTPKTDKYFKDHAAVMRAAGEAMAKYRASKSEKAGPAKFNQADQPTTAKQATTERASGPLDATLKHLGGKQFAKYVTQPIYRQIFGLGRFVPETWKAGIVSDYGLPEPYVNERDAVMANQINQARKTASIIQKMGSLTRAQSAIAYQWMSSNETLGDALLEQLPVDQQETLREVKKLITDMGKEAVELGQLSAEAYAKNKDAYLHRTYRKFELDDTKQEVVARTRAIKVLGNQYKGRGLRDNVEIANVGHVEKGEKFTRYEARDKNGRITKTHYQRVGTEVAAPFAGYRIAGTWEARYFDKGGKVGMWRDFTADELKKMGEIDEIRYSVAKTLHMMVRDVEIGKFFKWIEGQYAKDSADGLTIVTAPTGRSLSTFKPDEWVQVPSGNIPGTQTPVYGAIGGKFVPAAMWNDLRQVSAAKFQPFGDVVDAVLKFWKLSKTAYSPGTHMNNIISNFLMADFNDVSSIDVIKALYALGSNWRGKNEESKQLYERFKSSGAEIGSYILTETQRETIEPLLEELRREVDQADSDGALLKAVSIVHLFFTGHFRDSFNRAATSKLGMLPRKVKTFAMGAYQAEDTLFRMAAFIKAIREGKTDEQAGRFARDAFLNYHINAPWIANARATALPFIAFSYRAAPLLVKTAANKPWKLLKYWALAGALNALAYSMLGGDDDREKKERALHPQEKSGKIWGVFPRLMRMWWNNDRDHPVFLDIRRWIPVGDILDTDQNHSAVPLPQTLMPGGPLMTIAEILLNKSSFTGKPIVLDTDTAEEKAWKIGKYLFQTMAPNNPVVPGSPSFMKLWDANKGKTDAFGREHSLSEAAWSSIGIKLSAYPSDVLMKNIKGKYDRDVMELTQDFTKTKREYAQKGLTTDEFREKQKLYEVKRRELAKKIQEKLSLR